MCNYGHQLVKLSDHYECFDCPEVYFPKDTCSEFAAKDLVREQSILNNDTTSFVVLGQDPINPKKRRQIKTRTPALTEIIGNSCKRSHNKKRKIEKWNNPPMCKYFTEEGHNVMVLNMLFKNVIVRWDKDYLRARQLFGWNIDHVSLKESRKGQIMSEIIINYKDNEVFKIVLPMKYLEDQITQMRCDPILARWINYRHPGLCIKEVRKLKNN